VGAPDVPPENGVGGRRSRLNLDDAYQVALVERDRAVEQLFELLSIPSISAERAHLVDVAQAAEWVAEKLRELGMAVVVGDGESHPFVVGELMSQPGAPTVGIYAHFDVQPVDPLDEWLTPPFTPELREGAVFARGASDDKGPLVATLMALEYAVRCGGPSVNVRVFFEGEEEISGSGLGTYVLQEGSRLQTDHLVIVDGMFHAPGLPALVTGLRGLIHFMIEVTGADEDLHSGLYGGIAPNPLNSLARILAGLKTVDGRICVPGFYDDVEDVSDEQRSVWDALAPDEGTILNTIGAEALEGEKSYSVCERLWTRPSLDVHGITGGFSGEGVKTVIPRSARAKGSLRLVPRQDPAHVFAALSAHVERLATPGVRVKVENLGGSPAVVFGESHALVTAAARHSMWRSEGDPYSHAWVRASRSQRSSNAPWAPR
jgi:acetylornithine deacetylase/succinyl-diaminopimelate desuccinylase-like protein